MSEEKKGLTERIGELEGISKEIIEELQKKKTKKFRLWTKGLLGKAKLRKGYCVILVINENGSAFFKKEPIIEGVVKVGDTFHAIDKDSIFTYKNKPFLIIAKNRVNPYNPLQMPGETHGDRYILARMQNEAIKPKKTIGAIGWWIFILAIIGIVAYYFMGKGGA